MPPKFSLGQLVATPGALAALKEAEISFWPYIRRHQEGDWGNVTREDACKIWIITEADRSATTILLPEEY
jgi:hypothetical protein